LAEQGRAQRGEDILVILQGKDPGGELPGGARRSEAVLGKAQQGMDSLIVGLQSKARPRGAGRGEAQP